MLKKFLMIMGALFLVGIIACAGILFWAQRSGSELQAKFFEAVDSGDPLQVRALFHSALRAEVDEPVLAAWMKEVDQRLGKFQGLSKTNFNTSSKYVNGVTRTESKGTVNFEKGTASSELLFHDGQLIKFSIDSEKIPPKWFTGPADSQLYQQRAEEFLRHILSGETEEAFAMLHEEVQKQIGAEKWQTVNDQALELAGKLNSLEHQSDNFDVDGQELTLRFMLHCEKADIPADVSFQYAGLKGHLVGFHLLTQQE